MRLTDKSRNVDTIYCIIYPVNVYTQDVDRCITDHSTWNTLRLSEVGPNRIGTQNPFLLSLFLYNSKVEKRKEYILSFASFMMYPPKSVL
jgi:hypothetical protein